MHMNSNELRDLQSPLKEKYRADPRAAVVTLRAEGLLSEEIACSVNTGRALLEAGLHPATGGTGFLACSGDLLLQALAACAGVTLKAVATAIGVEIRSGSVLVEGDIDFRGTLAVSKDVEVGFRSIRLIFSIDTNAKPEERESLLKLTKRYCVVFQTLSKGVPIETLFES
jgi:uncharacterized OsmC-like protein